MVVTTNKDYNPIGHATELRGTIHPWFPIGLAKSEHIRLDRRAALERKDEVNV